MGDLGPGEITNTIICFENEKGPNVTQSLTKTHAYWVRKRGHCQKKRLPPEWMEESSLEGDMAPPEGWLEVFFSRINFLINVKKPIPYPEWNSARNRVTETNLLLCLRSFARSQSIVQILAFILVLTLYPEVVA
jgi:hypothetical protein